MDPGTFSALRYGAFGKSAHAFALRHRVPCTSATERMQALCAAIVAHLEQHDDVRHDQEEEFAGYYACVLIDQHSGQHRSRNNKHWVAVGAYGYIDPFDSIERILEADTPMQQMRAQLLRAEGEANAQIGIGRVARLVHTSLAQHQCQWCEHFASEVTLSHQGNTRTLDLREVLASTETASMVECEHLVTDWLRAVLSGQVKCYPRIIGARFVAPIPREELWTLPFLDELELACVEHTSTRVRFLKRLEASASVWAQALANLHAHVGDPSVLRWQKTGEVLHCTTTEGFAAARVLAPSLRADVQRVLGHDAWFALPHRDRLLVAPATAERELRDQCQSHFARAPHAISDKIYRLHAVSDAHVDMVGARD